MLDKTNNAMTRDEYVQIELDLSSFAYRKGVNILENISLSYYSDTTTIITGPVGSGKTTLLNTLAGIIPNIESHRATYYSGMLTYKTNGQNTTSITEENYRWFLNKISFLFQYPDNNFIADNVIDEFKLLDKIVYDSSCTDFEKSLHELDIRDLAFKKLNELSEGQKQLIALACIFLRNPSVIFLDEPLTMLDKKNRKLFLSWVVKYKTNCPWKGIVIATHRAKDFEVLSPEHYTFHNKTFYQSPFPSEILEDVIPSKVEVISPYYQSTADQNSLISLNNVSIRYKNSSPIKGLSSLNFSIGNQQHILISGDNGTGKTTLAKTLCGVHKKFSGTIMFDNKNISNIDPIKSGLAKLVVQIPSQQIIFKTVREDICFAIRHLNESQINGIISEIRPFLDKFNIPLDVDPHRLSFGQQKIVCLLSNLDFPKVLLIDEPAISMDIKQQDTILEIISFYQNKGVTTIIITHDSDIFKGLCDVELTLVN